MKAFLGHAGYRCESRCSWHHLAALLFLLALIARGAYALLAGHLDPFLRVDALHGDAASYDRIARNLLAGHGFGEQPGALTTFWPPLYPLFLAGLYRVCGYNPLAARMAQACLGAVAVVSTTMSVDSVAGRRAAILTGFGMALYPPLIYFGAWLIADALHLFLLALALLLAARLQAQPSYRGFAALGFLLGLATLAKPATLLLVPLVVVWVWLAPPPQQVEAKLVQCLVLVALTLVTILPWTVRNYLVSGDFVLVSTNGGYTFYGANNPEAFGGHREGFPPHLPGFTQAQAEREYYRLGMDWILQQPDDFAKLALRKLARLLSPLSVASSESDYPIPAAGLVKAIYTGFLALAVAGALCQLHRWRSLAILYALVLYVALGAVVFYGDVRYTLPMVSALVAFASLALVSLCDRLNAQRHLAGSEALRTHGGRSR